MKKIISIFLVLLLNACGFQPIYNSNNIEKFSLKILSTEGDREINNFISRNLRIYTNDLYEKNYSLKINSNYKKNILTKNKQGKATDYQLTISTNFKIISEKNNSTFQIIKNFNIKNLDDSFQEKEYERSIKQNLVNIITSELINKISLME